MNEIIYQEKVFTDSQDTLQDMSISGSSGWRRGFKLR